MKTIITNGNPNLFHVIPNGDELKFVPIIDWDIENDKLPTPVTLELPQHFGYLFVIYDRSDDSWLIDSRSIRGEGKELLISVFSEYTNFNGYGCPFWRKSA